jgi:hypothetical protein
MYFLYNYFYSMIQLKKYNNYYITVIIHKLMLNMYVIVSQK